MLADSTRFAQMQKTLRTKTQQRQKNYADFCRRKSYALYRARNVISCNPEFRLYTDLQRCTSQNRTIKPECPFRRNGKFHSENFTRVLPGGFDAVFDGIDED